MKKKSDITWYFWSKMGGDGVGVLCVRFRMKGVFATTNALSRFFILWLGIAPNFPVFFLRVSVRRLLGASAPNSLRAETRKKRHDFQCCPATLKKCQATQQKSPSYSAKFKLLRQKQRRYTSDSHVYAKI